MVCMSDGVSVCADRNDFASIVCRTFKLNYHEVVNQISTDGHGMFSIRSFMMYMQKQYEGAQRSNGIIGDHTHGYYNHDIAFNRYVCKGVARGFGGLWTMRMG